MLNCQFISYSIPLKADMIRIITLFCCSGEQYGPYVSFVSTLRFGYNLKKYYDCENKDYFKKLAHRPDAYTTKCFNSLALSYIMPVDNYMYNCGLLVLCGTEWNGTELVKRRNWNLKKRHYFNEIRLIWKVFFLKCWCLKALCITINMARIAL